MRLAVLDAETTWLKIGERPRLLFWGLADETGYRRFESTSALVKYLQSAATLRIFHHHDFDPIILLWDRAPLTVRSMRSGRILSSTLGRHELRNSLAVFPSSLKAILESCGFQKRGLDDLDARNVDDTVSALAAFERLGALWRDLYGVDPLRDRYMTAAGVSFAAAQRVAGDLPVDLRDRHLFRGGRVEAARLGAVGTRQAFDIQSSYPASFINAPETDELLIGVATVRDATAPPPLMRLTADRSKLLFPVGRFRSTVYKSNLDRITSTPGHGIVSFRVDSRETVDLSWVRNVEPLIKHAFEGRKEAKRRGDKAQAFMQKILINSIFGRIGKKLENEHVHHETDPDIIEKDEIGNSDESERWNLPDGTSITFEPRSDPRTRANYRLAAWITDTARRRLWEGLARVDDPVYWDTDSVYCRSGVPGRIGEELGDWASEGSAEMSIRGAKDYTFGAERKMKGGVACENCHRIMRQGPTASLCVECLGPEAKDADGRNGGELQTRFSLKSMLRHGKVVGGCRAERSRVEIGGVETVVNRYDKREALLGAGLTRPWEFSE